TSRRHCLGSCQADDMLEPERRAAFDGARRRLAQDAIEVVRRQPLAGTNGADVMGTEQLAFAHVRDHEQRAPKCLNFRLTAARFVARATERLAGLAYPGDERGKLARLEREFSV